MEELRHDADTYYNNTIIQSLLDRGYMVETNKKVLRNIAKHKTIDEIRVVFKAFAYGAMWGIAMMAVTLLQSPYSRLLQVALIVGLFVNIYASISSRLSHHANDCIYYTKSNYDSQGNVIGREITSFSPKSYTTKE